METNIKLPHFSLICRFCLKRGVLLQPIFHEIKNRTDFASKEESITEMIEKCTRIEMSLNDSLPKLMCIGCLDQLFKFNSFRQQCLKSDKILKSIVGNSRNEEIHSEFDMDQSKSNPENSIKMEIFIENEGVNEQSFHLEDPSAPIKANIDSPIHITTTNSSYTISEIAPISTLSDHLMTIKTEPPDMDSSIHNTTINSSYTISEITPMSTLSDQLMNIKRETLDITPNSTSNLINNNELHYIQSEQSFPSIAASMNVKVNSNVKPKTSRVPCTCPNCASGKNQSAQKKLHTCHIPGCNKVYGKTAHLKGHLIWHTGKRPFSCTFCEKNFTRSDELQRHVRTHTGEKRYECSECSKKFMRSDHLSKHIKTHNKPRNIH